MVLAHAGGVPRENSERAEGEILSEAEEMDAAVDVVVSGHTHSKLNVRVPNRDGEGDKLVVQADSYGRAFDRVLLTVDRGSGEVVAKSAEIETVPPTRRPDRRWPRSYVATGASSHPLRGGALAAHRSRLLRERPEGRGNLGQTIAEAQRSFAKTDIAFVDQTTCVGTSTQES